jgi:hypothetical protein
LRFLPSNLDFVISAFQFFSFLQQAFGFQVSDFRFPWPVKSALAREIVRLFHWPLAREAFTHSLLHWVPYFTGPRPVKSSPYFTGLLSTFYFCIVRPLPSALRMTVATS